MFNFSALNLHQRSESTVRQPNRPEHMNRLNFTLATVYAVAALVVPLDLTVWRPF